jgi:tRNA-binding EMAP/Myf-like protein
VNVRDHPNGDRIWLADVDLGRGGQPVQIVFGGEPVVRPDSLVPVAPPGSRLHGVKMRRRNYRGQASYGMLCSLAELGWDPGVTDRVAMLAPSARLKPGTSLDERANDWQSIIFNPRAERARVWNTATLRQVLSGEWHPSKRGLPRRRVRQVVVPLMAEQQPMWPRLQRRGQETGITAQDVPVGRP